VSVTRVKTFLKKWAVPPGFMEMRRRRTVPAIQKFWTGGPLDAPPAETSYFRSAGCEPAIITRDDDSRSSGRIERSARLPLPERSAGEAVQTAVTAAQSWPDRATIRLTIAGRTTSHSGLSAQQWLDVRLDVPRGATHLEIESDAPVFVSAPRAVNVSAPPPAGVQHVLVLVLDAWTPRLAAASHPTEPDTPLTPNIDRFFADGFSAVEGYSSGEWTMPTSASFFTGLCTARHRVFHPYAPTTLPRTRRLLAEYFQDAGFHTLAMSVANRLTPAYGHQRGFDRFVYHFPEPGFTKRRYDPAVWLADVVGHLDAHRYDRTFSYVHLPDVHPVWEIPPITRAFNLGRRGSSTGLNLVGLRQMPDAADQGRQLYSLRLHEVDRQLGGLFDYIERNAPDRTLVVLTSDHGTPWHYLRPTRPRDEPFLVDDRTAVAFYMRGPGVPAARRDGLTSPNVDLMPTVLARAGITTPDDLDGRDLLDGAYHRDYTISESVFNSVYEIAVRDGRRVYIERYPIDESSVRITGSASYAALFPAGAASYAEPLAEPAGALGEIARAHVDRYLMRGEAA
jgi:arylsulfatase A-like enzyme